ncbi:MAG: phosphatidate cytidylyltransferase [Sterolibacteriaceae bacterium]|nr:phosphatidate cytidylyltransferase [Sterolibacteriaceae bacterium]MBK9085255.1 phosphatidate cytidylyltransferase [Sterolibacteriaceae bacterium]
MLRQRVATALVLVSALLSAIFLLPQNAWLLFVGVLVVVATTEWSGLIGLLGVARIIYCAVTAVVFLAACLAGGLAGTPAEVSPQVLLFVFGIGAGFWLAVAPLWLSGKWPLRAGGVGVVVGWLVVIPAGLALVHLRAVDPLVLLAAMAVVWVADIAAYFVGRAIGRRKLAPGISPGKSWEGALGAVVFVVVYGFVVTYGWPQLGLPSPSGVSGVLGFAAGLVLITAVSIVGDLFESLAKRQAGVKDSGNILPGHGGILDRIDSLTSTLPLVSLALMLTKS